MGFGLPATFPSCCPPYGPRTCLAGPLHSDKPIPCNKPRYSPTGSASLVKLRLMGGGASAGTGGAGGTVNRWGVCGGVSSAFACALPQCSGNSCRPLAQQQAQVPSHLNSGRDRHGCLHFLEAQRTQVTDQPGPGPVLGWTPNSDRQILPLPSWGSEPRGPLSSTGPVRIHAGPSESFGLGWLSWPDLAVLSSTQAHSLQKRLLQRRVLWACRKNKESALRTPAGTPVAVPRETHLVRVHEHEPSPASGWAELNLGGCRDDQGTPAWRSRAL